MENEASPGDRLDRLIHFWWVLVVCMLLGAVIGWLFHFTQPSIYEAKSTISVAINYAETGLMTDLEEDHALSVVGEAILSDDVIQDLRQRLGSDTPVDQLRASLFAEREGYRWVLRARAPSREEAVRISETWADAALASLDQSLVHAQNALILSRQISSLESCLREAYSNSPSAFPCELPGSSNLQSRLMLLGDQYRGEQRLGNGILPAMVFSLTQKASSSGTPVSFRTAELVFAGAMIGFLLGIILMLAAIPAKHNKGN